MTAPDRLGSSDASANTATRAVGIDVSKASLEVVILGKDADGSASRSMPNTEDGFDMLREWIDREVEVGLEEVHACLEASGGYERPVARYLHEQNLTVSVVNPRRTSAYADSRLNRSKTDPVDARLLARFCQREEPSSWQPASSGQKDLKDMTRGLQSLKKERDRLKNKIDQSSNPTVTSSLQSVLESINEQIDQLEEGDLRSPASTSTFNAAGPLPESKSFWKRSPASAQRPPRWCSRNSGIRSASRAPARRPPTQD